MLRASNKKQTIKEIFNFQIRKGEDSGLEKTK